MSKEADTTSISPRTKTWMILGIIFALLGLAISVYAAYHDILVTKFGKTDAACNINAQLSCDAVALSEYSELLGIPLGVWGAGYFMALLILCCLVLFSKEQSPGLKQAYGFYSLIGFVTSIILAIISFAVLKVGCVNCIGIYGITTGQFLALLFFWREIPKKFSIDNFNKYFGIAALIVVATVLIFSLTGWNQKPSISSVQPESTDETNITASHLKENVIDIPIYKSPYSGKGEDYRKGGEDAKVVIVKFSDFECPACKRMAMTLDQVLAEFGDKVQIVYKNYPLDNKCNSAITRPMHKYACDVAILARCSGLYGKFWEFHNLAFKEQSSISAQAAIGWAKEVGLSEEQIKSCQSDSSLMEKIKDDIQLANTIGVDATPTLYINGRQFVGRGYDALQFEIKNMLE